MKKLTRSEAQQLLEKYLQEPNNRFHSYESEVVMRAVARHLDQDEELWGLAGLLHDLDWEQTSEDFSRHGLHSLDILAEEGYEVDPDMAHAISSHNEAHTGVKRETAFDYALAAGESITGLIYAYALMRPEKLNEMKAKSLNKKFKDKHFARPVSREFISDIEKAGIEKSVFFDLAIGAMQAIAGEIGLE